jgi:spore maturation protein CgeB
MKVFHAGITSAVYSSEAITQSFKDVVGDVCYFNWQENRFLYGVEGMRKELINKVVEYKPDVIFLHFNHTSEVLTLEYYEALKKLSKVITYTEDVRKDISHFENISAVVDHMIFTNIDDVETLASKGINNAVYLPVSYNHIWYKPQPKTDKYYGDIVFVGNNYVPTNMRDEFPNAVQRQEMIAALKKEFGDKFQAYGLGQENAMLNPQQVVECYNNAKIAITHNNFTRKGYQSDRGLNAMGCKCATVLHNYSGIVPHFGLGWDTFESLIHICKRFLSEDETREMVAHSQNRITTTEHSWWNRAGSIKKLING